MQTPTISSGDTAWVLISTALVLFMVPGLAFFYGGLVRSKSALNTMLMSLGALAIVTVQWVLFGYSLAFGPGSTWIGGLGFFGFQGVTAAPNPTYAAALPHLLFAITTIAGSWLLVPTHPRSILLRMLNNLKATLVAMDDPVPLRVLSRLRGAFPELAAEQKEHARWVRHWNWPRSCGPPACPMA